MSDQQVKILELANQQSRSILSENEAALVKLAKMLLTHDKLSQSYLKKWAENELGNKIPQERSATVYREMFEAKINKRYTPVLSLNSQKTQSS